MSENQSQPEPDDDARRARTFQFELELALRLCDAAATPFAASTADILRNGGLGQYMALRVDPECYNDPKHFAADYLVASVLRKSSSLPLGVDVAEVARQKFIEAERLNALTNDRLWRDPLPSWWGDYSRHLLSILGPLGEPELNEILDSGRHGGGASVGVSGDGVVPSDKYDSLPTVTAQLMPFIRAMLPDQVLEYLVSGSSDFRVVRGSRWFSVTKDAEGNRSCATEATWNMFYQLATGRLMRRRLRRFGVDLQNQGRNQFLASQAQVRGDATLDLKMASDMNARNAVFLALCHNGDPQGRRWYHLLNLLRSHEMRVPGLDGRGEWKPLEMFSSMGNGFTFPLETSIFLALCHSVVPQDEWDRIAVYGDDIIVPQEHAMELINRLEFVGFQVNRSKSHLAGRFFESCGTDWLDGQNVRPFYTRSDESEDFVPPALIAANRLREWSLRVYGCLNSQYLSVWQWCADSVPHPWNNLVPSILGDTGIHCSRSEAAPLRPAKDHTFRHKAEGTWEGWVVKHVVPHMETVEKRTFGVELCALARLELPLRLHSFSSSVDAGRRWVRDLARGGWRECAIEGAPWTLGLEPRRGYLRRISTTKTIVPFWDDIGWV